MAAQLCGLLTLLSCFLTILTCVLSEIYFPRKKIEPEEWKDELADVAPSKIDEVDGDFTLAAFTKCLEKCNPTTSTTVEQLLPELLNDARMNENSIICDGKSWEGLMVLMLFAMHFLVDGKDDVVWNVKKVIKPLVAHLRKEKEWEEAIRVFGALLVCSQHHLVSGGGSCNLFDPANRSLRDCFPFSRVPVRTRRRARSART